MLPGICTECGVCDEGESFGENVVFEPPHIPAFEGHYRPNSTRAQRLRFRHACRSQSGWLAAGRWLLAGQQHSAGMLFRRSRAPPALP